MQLATLVIIIDSGMHVHITVVNTKSDLGAFVKGEDDLSNWVHKTSATFDVPIEDQKLERWIQANVFFRSIF